MWKVYILLSKKQRKTYVGSTNDFRRRLEEHNCGKVNSTKLLTPWIPIYIEFYPHEESARKREKYLKTASGRRYLKQVINNIINEWTISSAG